LYNSYFAFHGLLALATQFDNSLKEQKCNVQRLRSCLTSGALRLQFGVGRYDERANFLKLLLRPGCMTKEEAFVDQWAGVIFGHPNFAGEKERLCLTDRFDIPRPNACASYQN